MTTPQLKKWNFSKRETGTGTGTDDIDFFPHSYKSYENLLTGDKNNNVNNCYSQNPEKNNINLWCAFLTAMNVKGTGGVIIDVDSSTRASKIVPSKGAATVNEVILRNVLKTNDNKVPVGLFRGRCGIIKSKDGLLNFFNVFGDKNLQCNPEEAKAQIAYFPRYYFEQFYKSIRDSGIAGNVLEKIKNIIVLFYN